VKGLSQPNAAISKAINGGARAVGDAVWLEPATVQWGGSQYIALLAGQIRGMCLRLLLLLMLLRLLLLLLLLLPVLLLVLLAGVAICRGMGHCLPVLGTCWDVAAIPTFLLRVSYHNVPIFAGIWHCQDPIDGAGRDCPSRAWSRASA